MGAFGPLVTARWLAGHLSDPDVRVVDCRWFYDHDSGTAVSWWAAYEAGHVPGAAFVDVDEGAPGDRSGAGRRPPPAPAAFERAMRRSRSARTACSRRRPLIGALASTARIERTCATCSGSCWTRAMPRSGRGSP
ncbi:MAG TPA: hypothetical protein VIC57_03585 [Candidatus Dormibacteraeota bacterium]